MVARKKKPSRGVSNPENVDLAYLSTFFFFDKYFNESDSIERQAAWFQEKFRNNYPVELDYAIKAWVAVCLQKSVKHPKKELKQWLTINTDLSNEAVERVATIANWDKKGGFRG